MVVINTHTDEAFENVNKTQAAAMIGVDRSTILRWSKQKKKEYYNMWVIYFNTEKLKK